MAEAQPASLALRAARVYRAWNERLLGLLYPPACAGCGAEISELSSRLRLCETCDQALVIGYPNACLRCAMPLGTTPGQQCLECHRRRHRFEQATALGKYEGALRSLVLRAKRGTDDALGLALGRRLAVKLAASGGPPPDALVSMPVPPLRRLFRAGNLADILAEAVSRELSLPRLPGLLYFCRSVRKQSNLTPAQRRRNVRGALATSLAYDLQGARLLVIDDVLTTGATADEAARALLAAGAASISVAVVARGVGFD